MKLTYTKAQLLREARAIPLANYPAELLTESQLEARNKRIEELNRKCAVYEDEKRRAKNAKAARA